MTYLQPEFFRSYRLSCVQHVVFRALTRRDHGPYRQDHGPLRALSGRPLILAGGAGLR